MTRSQRSRDLGRWALVPVALLAFMHAARSDAAEPAQPSDPSGTYGSKSGTLSILEGDGRVLVAYASSWEVGEDNAHQDGAILVGRKLSPGHYEVRDPDDADAQSDEDAPSGAGTLLITQGRVILNNPPGHLPAKLSFSLATRRPPKLCTVLSPKVHFFDPGADVRRRSAYVIAGDRVEVVANPDPGAVELPARFKGPKSRTIGLLERAALGKCALPASSGDAPSSR